MGVAAEFARMKGNMERLKELLKKWDGLVPAKVFVQQLDDLINGKPLSFYPNCQMCEECGKAIAWDEYAVNFGWCDDCLNRHLKEDGLAFPQYLCKPQVNPKSTH